MLRTIGQGCIYHEDGSASYIDSNGNISASSPPGFYSYSNGTLISADDEVYSFSSDGKPMSGGFVLRD